MLTFFFLLMLAAGVLALVAVNLPRFGSFFDPLARGDLYSANNTKNRTNPVVKVPVIDAGARVRFYNDSHAQVGAGTIGDVIHCGVGMLPVGAKIIPHLSLFGYSDGVATAVIDIGKTGAADALLADVDMETAATAAFDIPADGADFVTIDQDEEIILTNSVAALIDGQVLRWSIAYVENS